VSTETSYPQVKNQTTTARCDNGALLWRLHWQDFSKHKIMTKRPEPRFQDYPSRQEAEVARLKLLAMNGNNADFVCTVTPAPTPKPKPARKPQRAYA
jgi:hypothetical protein